MGAEHNLLYKQFQVSSIASIGSIMTHQLLRHIAPCRMGRSSLEMGSYNPYEWPYNWVTGFITPISGVMGPYLYLVGAHFVYGSGFQFQALCCQVSGEESSCYRYWIKNDSMENTRVVPPEQNQAKEGRRTMGTMGTMGLWVWCSFPSFF